MKKILLTSSGFDNKNIETAFKGLLEKNISEIKVLFIPRAAMAKDKKEYIEMCKVELIQAGVLENNLHTYDLSSAISKEDIIRYDAIYVTGGETGYLVDYMKNCDFKQSLDSFLENGGVYVGVSAGSIALANEEDGYLGYLKSRLKVHSEIGSENGDFEDLPNRVIQLTDMQAVLILEDCVRIIK